MCLYLRGVEFAYTNLIHNGIDVSNHNCHGDTHGTNMVNNMNTTATATDITTVFFLSTNRRKRQDTTAHRMECDSQLDRVAHTSCSIISTHCQIGTRGERWCSRRNESITHSNEQHNTPDWQACECVCFFVCFVPAIRCCLLRQCCWFSQTRFIRLAAASPIRLVAVSWKRHWKETERDNEKLVKRVKNAELSEKIKIKTWLNASGISLIRQTEIDICVENHFVWIPVSIELGLCTVWLFCIAFGSTLIHSQ